MVASFYSVSLHLYVTVTEYPIQVTQRRKALFQLMVPGISSSMVGKAQHQEQSITLVAGAGGS